MNKMTEAERAYLAGMIDGEGCIYISETQGRYFRLVLIITGTNEAHIRHCFELADGLGSVHYAPKTGKSADQWQWHVTAHQAVELLKATLPYLFLKARQAQLALDFQKHVDQSPAYNNQHPLPRRVVEHRRRMADQLKRMKLDGKQYDGALVEPETMPPAWRPVPLFSDWSQL